MIKNLKILKNFISMQSIDSHQQGNQLAITFISNYLTGLGFDVRIEGEHQTDQPVILATYEGRRSNQKIVVYGHYDVAPVKPTEQWLSQFAFNLEEIDGRLYGRGIADNKGPLFSRLEGMAELINSSAPIPEILWLIQGEEEIHHGVPVANEIFKKEIEKFQGKVFIDETGFNDLETGEAIAFLWSPNIKEKNLVAYHDLIHTALCKPRIEYRHLNKLNGIQSCPLLTNLVKDAIYIGFGPNDCRHNIHRENESLDIGKLLQHKTLFMNFLSAYAVCSIHE